MKKKLLTLLIVMLIFAPIGAAAATRTAFLERGIKFLCWSKASVVYKYNHKKVNSTAPSQQRSGILVNLLGIKKLGTSTSKTVYFDSRTELLIGAKFSGQTIGWATTVVDRFTVRHNGSSSIKTGI